MNNLIPTQITDKNGKRTTVHKKVESAPTGLKLPVKLAKPETAQAPTVADAFEAHRVELEAAANGEVAMTESTGPTQAEKNAAAREAITQQFIMMDIRDPNTSAEALDACLEKADAKTRQYICQHPNLSLHAFEVLSEDEDSLVRWRIAMHANLPASLVEKLVDDGGGGIREAAVRNPAVPVELLIDLYERSEGFHAWLALNPSTPPEIVNRIHLMERLRATTEMSPDEIRAFVDTADANHIDSDLLGSLLDGDTGF
jgi:hypothetical protein